MILQVASSGGDLAMCLMLVFILVLLFPFFRLIWRIGSRFGKKDDK